MKLLISTVITLTLILAHAAEPEIEVKINQPEPPPKAFKITLTDTAEITVGGVMLSKEQLAGVLSALANGVDAPSVLLEASPETAHGEVVKLHQLLLDSGIDKKRIWITMTDPSE